ncbi:MAG: hypothetical protein JSW16_04625 [Dehalococcoidales bacterium]|nr:MAG: hypothetical protein JSW16_04625 [Dehalococcoidales bacterium]
MPFEKEKPWFHGSPLELETLREGSAITQIEKLAQAFSHRPTIVSVSDGGKIKHDGKTKGRVYRIAEEITADDVLPHPRSSMAKEWEWITNREFKLEFLYEIPYSPDDILSESEIEELKEYQRKQSNLED